MNNFLKLLTKFGCCFSLSGVSEAVFSFLFVQILFILSKIPFSGLVFGDLVSYSIRGDSLKLVVFVVDVTVASPRIGFCSICDERLIWSRFESSLEWEHAISYSVFGLLERFGLSTFFTTNRAFRTKWALSSTIILSSHAFSSALEKEEKNSMKIQSHFLTSQCCEPIHYWYESWSCSAFNL